MKDFDAKFGAIWLAGALALNGIPGTGIYRSLFLLLGVVHLIWTIRNHLGKPIWPAHRPESALLLILTLWFTAQAITLSDMPVESLKAVASHWGKILIVIFMMVAFLAYSNDRPATRRWLILGVFLSGFFHVFATLGFQIWELATTADFRIGESLLGNYGYISPYTTAAASFLFADFVSRLVLSKPLLPFRVEVTGLFLLCTLIAEGLLAAKTGYLMLAIQCVIAGGIMIAFSKGHRGRVIAITSIVLILTLTTPFLFANRWGNSIHSIAYSVEHTNDIRATLTESYDQKHQTIHVDNSFFLRYAWGKAGLEAIAAHPLGYGYGTIGYGRHIQEQYGVSGVVSSHSGWIDFTIDNGIPGFLLLLLLMVAIGQRGWNAFILARHPAGLALIFYVINYMGRCVIDGHLVGSRLTGFAIATAALWAACAPLRDADPSN